MCRLYAQLANAPRSAEAALLCGARALAAQSRHHRDGWGLGATGPDHTVLFKAPRAAGADPHFAGVARTLRAPAVVAHIRKATVGSVQRSNAHPFRFQRWVFAHNGSLFGFERLRPRLWAHIRPELRALVRGSTDSEVLFYYLLSAMWRACPGGTVRCAAQAAAAIRDALGALFAWAEALGLEPPKVSFVLSNGTLLFAQRGGMELHLAASPGMIRVSSEPTDDAPWLLVPEGNLLVASPARILARLPPPEGFRVSWPAPLKPPPIRDNVSLLAA